MKNCFFDLGDSDAMRLYMQSIGDYPRVSLKEEQELAEQIAAGNEEARTKLILGNLRLVVKIAHDFKGAGLPLVDLISEGNIGLMRAVEKFDPKKGAKLSSYAAWWIKQGMRRALASQVRTIRIPIQSASRLGKISNACRELKEKLSREPNDAEVAVHLQLTERTVAGLRRGRTRVFSLQDPIQTGEEGEFKDIVQDEQALAAGEIILEHEAVGRASQLLARLTPRQREVLDLRFGLDGEKPRTLEEVSRKIGLTRERIRQIQNQAVGRLRKMADAEDHENEISAGQPRDAWMMARSLKPGRLPARKSQKIVPLPEKSGRSLF